MSQKEIVAEMLKNGAELVENVKIEGVKVTACTSEETGEIYYRVAMTTDKPVKTMRAQDDGTYVEGTIKVVMELFSNLLGALRTQDDYKKVINHINEHPKSLEILMAGAKMDVITVKVKAGSIYKNPFSRSDNEGREVKNNTFYHHVTNITPTKSNLNDINAIIKSILGI